MVCGGTRPKLAPLPPIGSTVEFIYLYELRYVGELAEANEAGGTFRLKSARHFGNENRVKTRPLPPLRIPFESMEFNWHYVRDVRALSDEEAWRVSLASLSLRPHQSCPNKDEANHGRRAKTAAPAATKAERTIAEQTKRRKAEDTRGKRILSQINSLLQGPR